MGQWEKTPEFYPWNPWGKKRTRNLSSDHHIGTSAAKSHTGVQTNKHTLETGMASVNTFR